MARLLREVLGFLLPWRLSGLLSGYLPTDTRPQARAKLGKRGNRCFESASQHFFHERREFLAVARKVLLWERKTAARDERLLKLLNEM